VIKVVELQGDNYLLKMVIFSCYKNKAGVISGKSSGDGRTEKKKSTSSVK